MSVISEFISRTEENHWDEVLKRMPRMIQCAIESVQRDISSGRTKGRATTEFIYPGIGDYNVIPSEMMMECTPILIVYCYNQDNLEGRIVESLDHATLSCPIESKHVFFLTTHWDSKIPKKLEGYIESVRSNKVEVNFIYITGKGHVILPV